MPPLVPPELELELDDDDDEPLVPLRPPLLLLVPSSTQTLPS